MKRVSGTALLRILLIGVVLVSAALILGKPKLPWPQSAVNEGPATGPATSWSTQLSTALAAARNDIKDPVLVAVQAETAGGPPEHLVEEQAFEVEFLFATDTPKRTLLYFDLNDVEPNQTVRKKIEFGFYPRFEIKPNLDEYASPLETVKLSPREVYNLTLSDASTTLSTSGLGYLVTMYLHLLPEFEGIPERPAVWSIDYSRAGVSNDKGWRVDYRVNAETGLILQRVEDMRFLTMAPSPAIP